MIPAFKHGIYHHHKGGIYRSLMLVRLSERRAQVSVVYDSLTPNPIEQAFAEAPWCRPLMRIMETPAEEDCWLDAVVWPDGQYRPRFVHESEITKDELMRLNSLRNTTARET